MSRERILVVDDDSLIRDILAERLEKKGFRVDRAGSLQEARAAVERAVPDVAILDVKLPDGEGTELLGRDLLEPRGVVEPGAPRREGSHVDDGELRKLRRLGVI